jgi:hypothetical protein
MEFARFENRKHCAPLSAYILSYFPKGVFRSSHSASVFLYPLQKIRKPERIFVKLCMYRVFQNVTLQL